MNEIAIALALIFQQIHALKFVENERIKDISVDIIAVVDKDIATNQLKSNMSRLDAISAVSGAIIGESSFSEKVEHCKHAGDGGKSIGLGQVMRGKNWEGWKRMEICTSRQLQIRLALHVLDRCWLRTPNARATFKCYTSGDAGKDSTVARVENRYCTKIKAALMTSLITPVIDLPIARQEFADSRSN
jgi:hypothetical protein